MENFRGKAFGGQFDFESRSAHFPELIMSCYPSLMQLLRLMVLVPTWSTGRLKFGVLRWLRVPYLCTPFSSRNMSRHKAILQGTHTDQALARMRVIRRSKEVVMVLPELTKTMQDPA